MNMKRKVIDLISILTQPWMGIGETETNELFHLFRSIAIEMSVSLSIQLSEQIKVPFSVLFVQILEKKERKRTDEIDNA